METEIYGLSPSQRRLATSLERAGLSRLEEAQNLVASDLIALPQVTPGDFAEIAVALFESGGFFTAAQPSFDLPLNTPIERIGLAERPCNAVRRRGTSTLGELLAWSPGALLALPNFGVTSLASVYSALDELGHRPGYVPGEPTGPAASCVDTTPSFRQPEKRAIAGALDRIASVQVHLHPGATVGDVLALLPERLRDRPATDLLFASPETSSLRVRIQRWLDELDDKNRYLLQRRSALESRVTLETVGEELSLTRERVRQLEQRNSQRLAADPLVAAMIGRLQSLAPFCSEEQFRGAGFDFDDVTAYVFMASRHIDVFPVRAEIKLFTVAGEKLVLIGQRSAGEEVDQAIRSLMADQPEKRFGAITELRDAVVVDLSAPGRELSALEPWRALNVVDHLLGAAPLWLDGLGGYVWFGHGRAAAIEARILHQGSPVPLRDLEDFYDTCFPHEEPESVATWDRRVTALIHNNPDLVRLGDGSTSHVQLGAEPSRGLKKRMLAALERSGGAMSLNQMVRQMIQEDPSTRPDSVNTYAVSGVFFEVQEGIVRQRTSPIFGDPLRNRYMYKVVEGEYAGLWSWQGQCSHDAMYRSSTSIPLALAGVLGLEIAEDAQIIFPTGSAEVGFSASAVYIRSTGGIREVFAAAGVGDGDRYRLIVTGPREAVCERMDPIDVSSPVSLIATTLGLNPENPCLELLPEALGLDPYAYTDDSLIELVRCRPAGFADAYFAINPDGADDL